MSSEWSVRGSITYSNIFCQERNPESAKRRGKFSDLVFTRQFTAFDRQNSESAGSPFHSFFTLFWLAVAIFMIRLAAANNQEYGSMLGSNEIMDIMFHRDVLVLGLSDGRSLTLNFAFIFESLPDDLTLDPYKGKVAFACQAGSSNQSLLAHYCFIVAMYKYRTWDL